MSSKYSHSKAVRIVKQTLKQEEVKIATLNIGLGEGSVVLSHSTAIAGLEARTALKLGLVKELFQYRMGHSVRLARRVITNIAIVTFKTTQVLDRYLTGKGFMMEIGPEKVEAYYLHPKKVKGKFGELITQGFTLMNSMGQPVKRSDIDEDNLYIVKPAYYGQAIKEGKIICYLLKKGEYSEEDHEVFMNVLTDEGYAMANSEIFQYADEKEIINKIKANYVRFATGKAGSVSMTGIVSTRYIKEALESNNIPTDFMVEGANYNIFDKEVIEAMDELPTDERNQLIVKCKLLYPEVAYFLGKLFSDGEGIESALYAAHIASEFTQHEISAANVLMSKPQSRQLGTTVKQAHIVGDDDLLTLQEQALIKLYGSEIHVVTYEDMDEDPQLAHEFMQARVGNFLGKFKKNDIIKVRFRDIDHKGSAFLTLDEIKHISSYRTMYEETILKWPEPDGEYKVALSSQVITSAFSNDPEKTDEENRESLVKVVEYLSERGAEGIKGMFDGITKKQADKYLPLEEDILTKDIYTISALNREIPGLIVHNSRLYQQNLKDVMNASEKVINKNQTLGFWGENFTITPDLSNRIMPGYALMNDFEIFVKDWKIMKEMIIADLEAKLKVETDEEQIELLKLEIAYVKTDRLLVIRHPKNHPGQFGVYKVVTMDELLVRSRKRIKQAAKTKKFFWNEECHAMYKRHLIALKAGIAMTPPTELFKGLHSGPDYDSDIVTAIADRRLVEMAEKNKPVATYLNFKTKSNK